MKSYIAIFTTVFGILLSSTQSRAVIGIATGNPMTTIIGAAIGGGGLVAELASCWMINKVNPKIKLTDIGICMIPIYGQVLGFVTMVRSSTAEGATRMLGGIAALTGVIMLDQTATNIGAMKFRDITEELATNNRISETDRIQFNLNIPLYEATLQSISVSGNQYSASEFEQAFSDSVGTDASDLLVNTLQKIRSTSQDQL